MKNLQRSRHWLTFLLPLHQTPSHLIALLSAMRMCVRATNIHSLIVCPSDYGTHTCAGYPGSINHMEQDTKVTILVEGNKGLPAFPLPPLSCKHFISICKLRVHFFKNIGSLSMRIFETRTATGSELFSLVTCPHTTTFTLLSIFSPLQITGIKIWETIQS